MLSRSIKFYVDYACLMWDKRTSRCSGNAGWGSIKLLFILRSSEWYKIKLFYDRGDDRPVSIRKSLKECLGGEVGPLYHLQHQVRVTR